MKISNKDKAVTLVNSFETGNEVAFGYVNPEIDKLRYKETNVMKHFFQQAFTFILLVALLDSTTYANDSTTLPEAPSTVNASYVEPSSTRKLKPGEKIGSLFSRNANNEYVLQRLTGRTYWVQRNYYATIFHIGDHGVLLFDPLDGAGKQIKNAIESVTALPVQAIVYSHNHADHIGNASEFTKNNSSVRIIASEETAAQQVITRSSHPKPTDIVAWPNGSFKFEDLTVELHGFENAAHSKDHGIWLLKDEKIAHIPDLINPDQPPFWGFAGSETFLHYEDNIEQLANLRWDFLSGGHGNVGSKEDIQFYRTFLADLKKAVGEAMGKVAWGTGVDASKVNAHTAFLPAWLDAVSKHATDELRPKYGQFYGFEAATPRNAEMVAFSMFDYR